MPPCRSGWSEERELCFSNIACGSYRVPLSVLCLDEISQSDTRQLLPDAVDVDTQSIIINIKLIIPKEIYNITARTYFPCVLKKIVEYF